MGECEAIIVTFTFRALSRRFYPKRLTISKFVIRSETIYGCCYVLQVATALKSALQMCFSICRFKTMPDQPSEHIFPTVHKLHVFILYVKSTIIQIASRY